MFSLVKIAKLLELPPCRHLPISEFGIDSRCIAKGGVFFALPGERTDGHVFLEEVANKGAFAAVVSKTYEGPDFGLVLLYVDDVLESLQTLAKLILEERKTKIIGITGSVGKTTTKEFIFHILSKKFKIHKNPRSFNSQRTLPLVILNAKGDEDYLLLEMSMSEKGQIAKLVEIAKPSIVVVTPIAYCHAENFESLEEIGKAKAEVFTSSCEFAVIHYQSIKLQPIEDACICEHVIYPGFLPVKSPFVESHFTENFAAAFEVAKYLGLTDREIENRLIGLKPFNQRFEKKNIQGITFIDDTYNANPTSMIAALMNLPAPTENGKKIAVLGDMGELGQFSFSSHMEVGKVALNHVDELFCIGKECRPMVDVFEKANKVVCFFSDYQKLKEAVKKRAEIGDVVLVKGSNYHKLWEIFDFMGEKS